MTDHLIYIADDEKDLRELLKEVLETEGHDVRTVPHGEALLDLVDEHLPDLVLLDIAMPGLSGWEVKRKLLEHRTARDVPVIAITAQGGESIETSVKNALGFQDFLQKPFRMAELIDRTNTVLDGQAGR